MKILSCLTQNVSVVLEKVNTTPQPKHRLNFKNKKRRAGTGELSLKPLCSRRNACFLRSCVRNNESVVGHSFHGTEAVHLPFQDAVDRQYPESKPRSDDDYLSHCVSIQPPALSAATSQSLTYRKFSLSSSSSPSDFGEINRAAGGSYTDYLPSHEVHSPMQESTDDEMDAKDIPFPVLRQNPTARKTGITTNDSIASTGSYATCYNDENTYASISCDSDGQYSKSRCSTSDNVTFMPSVSLYGNFEQAFIRSTGNPPPGTPSETVGSGVQFAHKHTSYPNKALPSIPLCTAKEFPQNSVTQDPCDSVEKEEDEIDIETVSQSSSASEFLGCMSFGVGSLLKKVNIHCLFAIFFCLTLFHLDSVGMLLKVILED